MEVPSDLLQRLVEEPTDQETWGKLYKEVGPWVYAHAAKWLHNRTDAEDVTQAVFLQLARRWRSLRFESAPPMLKYLKKVTTSRVADVLRRRRARKLVQIENSDYVPDDSDGDSEDVLPPKTMEELLARLDDPPLSDRQKKILWHHYSGEPSSTISTLLGVSERTVRREIVEIRKIVRSA